MINPSASGWIDKFFIEQKISEKTVSKTTDTFYQKVRETGFIYGHIITFDTVNTIETKGWFKEEVMLAQLVLEVLAKRAFDSIAVETKDDPREIRNFAWSVFSLKSKE